MRLGRKTVCKDLAKEGMNTGGVGVTVIKMEGDCLCSYSESNLGTDSA